MTTIDKLQDFSSNLHDTYTRVETYSHATVYTSKAVDVFSHICAYKHFNYALSHVFYAKYFFCSPFV